MHEILLRIRDFPLICHFLLFRLFIHSKNHRTNAIFVKKLKKKCDFRQKIEENCDFRRKIAEKMQFSSKNRGIKI